jgi:hypothetical protein
VSRTGGGGLFWLIASIVVAFVLISVYLSSTQLMS